MLLKHVCSKLFVQKVISADAFVCHLVHSVESDERCSKQGWFTFSFVSVLLPICLVALQGLKCRALVVKVISQTCRYTIFIS